MRKSQIVMLFLIVVTIFSLGCVSPPSGSNSYQNQETTPISIPTTISTPNIPPKYQSGDIVNDVTTKSVTQKATGSYCNIGTPADTSKSSLVEISSLTGRYSFNSFFIEGKIKNRSDKLVYTAVSGIACDKNTNKCASDKSGIVLQPNEIQDFSIFILGGKGIFTDAKYECEAWIDYLQ